MAFGNRLTGNVDSGMKYLKWDDGPHTGVVCGEEATGFTTWTKDGPVYDPDGSFKIVFSFYVPGDGMKILEGGRTLARALKELMGDHDLEKSLITAGRTGTGFNTRYSATFVRDLTGPERTKLAKVPIHDLAECVSWVADALEAEAMAAEEDTPDEDPIEDDDIPF